jgi:phenylacetate-CoA ligase
MKIRAVDRAFVQLMTLVDALQGGILKNYGLFSLIVGHAPQRFGARACGYRAFREFEIARRHVPAYAEFLRRSGWSCNSADSRQVFESLPVMDKQNYILPFTTEQRCLGGRFLAEGVMIDESSGSTGVAYNWVRSRREREIVRGVIAVYLRYCFGEGPFVVLNTFSMGAWATGFNMALATQSLGVVKSTGPDVDKILHTLRFFGNKYPYILNGYPPFLKYLIDEGNRRGFPWKEYDVQALVGGEGMSEGLRDYLLRYCKTVYSGYGASDLEIGIGAENPLAVRIRRLCQHDAALRKTLFGEDQRLPMLFQYNPLDHYVEVVDREVVVTVSKPWTLSPRIRYNIKDEGGMITFDAMSDRLKAHGIDLVQLERECNYPRWYLPFLFIFGRKDSTVSIMGANIYPEDVESIVYSDVSLASLVNSYMISLEEDAGGNPRPCFDFELLDVERRGEVEEKLARLLPEGLAGLSLDYRKAREEYPESVAPIIRTYAQGEGPFRENETRIKKRYVAKSTGG